MQQQGIPNIYRVNKATGKHQATTAKDAFRIHN